MQNPSISVPTASTTFFHNFEIGEFIFKERIDDTHSIYIKRQVIGVEKISCFKPREYVFSDYEMRFYI